MATTPQQPIIPSMDQRQAPPDQRDAPLDHAAATPIERAEGAELRRPPEQTGTAAAPPITTGAEPIRPTPDDALHGMPPDLTHGNHAHREADEALHWGALAAIAIVVGLFLWALGTLIFTAG